MAAKGNKHEISYAMDHIGVAAIETTLWSIESTMAEVVNHLDVQHETGGRTRDRHEGGIHERIRPPIALLTGYGEGNPEAAAHASSVAGAAHEPAKSKSWAGTSYPMSLSRW